MGESLECCIFILLIRTTRRRSDCKQIVEKNYSKWNRKKVIQSETEDGSKQFIKSRVLSMKLYSTSSSFLLVFPIDNCL